jgi:hypothetical protein
LGTQLRKDGGGDKRGQRRCRSDRCGHYLTATQEKEITMFDEFENIYDDEMKTVEIEGIFTREALEKIVELMREKE